MASRSQIYRFGDREEIDWEASPIPGVLTLSALFLESSRRHADRPAISYRIPIRYHEREVRQPNGVKQNWNVPEFGPVTTLTYREYSTQVRSLATGLQSVLSLAPDTPVDSRFVGICMSVRFEFMMTELALWLNRCTAVPMSEMGSEELFVHMLTMTNCVALVTDATHLEVFCRLKNEHSEELSFLTTVIVCGTKAPLFDESSFVSQVERNVDTIRILRFEDVFENVTPVVTAEQIQIEMDKEEEEEGEIEGPVASGGGGVWNYAVGEPEPDDIGVICHTSGTTNLPKGVPIKHRNLIAGTVPCIHSVQMTSEDVIVSYLPLFHILGQGCDSAVLASGAHICYGTPKTLTDQGALPQGDFACFRPTWMLTVPRVFETMKKKIENRVNSSACLLRWLFQKAFAAKLAKLRREGDAAATPWWDRIVFNKFKALFGGRMRAIATGGAPISRETQEFVKVLLHPCIVGQAYGSTETAGGGTIRGAHSAFRAVNCGSPNIVTEFMLVSVPEMGYTVEDPTGPKGEIWIRGPPVVSEYYKNPEETSLAFAEDGWYKTGDIGAQDMDDQEIVSFKIIDRIKAFMKLSNGEYVSPEHLQLKYGNSRFASPNGVCVIASSLHAHVAAVVVPDVEFVESWAHQQGIRLEQTDPNLADLCQIPELKDAILEDFARIAREENLKGWERIRCVFLFPEPFSTENGLANGTMKIQRRAVMEQFRTELEDFFERMG